jgi:hydroxyacid-oxoacid transhydrogenase
MTPAPSRASILRLINASQHTNCPCHGSHVAHNAHAITNQLRRLAVPVEKVDKEYAFEVPTSLLVWCRYGKLDLGCRI